MRISNGFSNKISKVNTTFYSEKTKLYIYEEKLHYFASKSLKIAQNFSVFYAISLSSSF